MLFTSYGFILFLLILFIVYYLIPRKFQWMLLLGASFVFYSFSGWDNVAFISITIATTYLFTTKIGRLHQTQDAYLKENKESISKEEKKAYKGKIKSRQFRLLLACLLLNLGILAVLKYTNFAISSINPLLQTQGWGQISFWTLALPMGISFYTFQAVGYLVDVYRGKYPPERNMAKLALFVSFFPQLIQGPISRFDDLSQTLFKEHVFSTRDVSFGLQRILWGLFKKLVIADRIIVAVTTLIKDTDTYQGIYVFLLILFYTIQLYADFTGGIDITIGVAQVLGIKVAENFQRPFFSKSIVEFWRRWHITMSTWFRDYIFYPISISRPMLKLSKSARAGLGDKIGKRVPVYLSTIVVWFATGIWHGAGWNFIVWGLLNGLIIIVSQECTPFYEWFHRKFHVSHLFAYRLFQVVRTFLLMSTLRVLDCYRDVGLTFRQVGTIFTKWNIGELFQGSLLKLGLNTADYIVLLAGICVITAASLIQRSGSVREKLAAKPEWIRFAVYVLLILAILVFGAYGTGYDSNQFIYNQF